MVAFANTHENAKFKGIMLMVASTLFMGLNNALLKWLTGSIPTTQLLFMRSSVICVIVLVIAARYRSLSMVRMANPRGHLMWGGMHYINGILFILSVTYLPLADAIAIGFAGPLFLTALAIPFLGEKVGWRRWSAVIVGFIGIVIITRPTPEAFRIVALLPLGVALSGAIRDIATRKMTAREGSLAIMFSSSLISMAGTVPAAPFGWVMPGPAEWGLAALTGCCVCLGQYFMIETFRFAEANVVAPLRYTSIIWSVILGYMVWGDIPDSWAITGTLIVIASGIYILHREYKLREG
jgi:drug/metabolite transporter (DMT)-like permease